MTNRKNTRRALVLSLLSLLLCCSMLVGTTFAWFTDSVTSNQNTIVAGNLDVELYYTNSATVAADPASTEWIKVEKTTNTFGYDNWEPGFTKVVYFKVVNEGTLALKYKLSADVYTEKTGTNQKGQEFKLSDYLYTALVNPGVTRDEILSMDGTNFTGLKMAESGTEPLAPEATKVVGLAIWMPTTVNNDANHNGEDVPEITFGINLYATQVEAESDSFGKDYDESATYPAGAAVNGNADNSTVLQDGEVKVEIPVGAAGGNYSLEATAMSTSEENGNTTATVDISLLKDGTPVPNDGTEYTVTVKIGAGLNLTKVLHDGVEIPASDYRYDIAEGTITFKTTHFSPFSFTYNNGAEVATAAEFTAALANNRVVNLTGDIEMNDIVFIGSNVQINGNGHKIISKSNRVIRITTSNVQVVLNDVDIVSNAAMHYPDDVRGISIDGNLANIELVLNSCSVTFTDSTTCDWTYAINVAGDAEETRHSITINGGAYEGANVINARGTKNTITVKNATLTSKYPKYDTYYGACIWTKTGGGSTVIASGNTFVGEAAIAFNMGSGNTLKAENNTDNTGVVALNVKGENTSAHQTLAEAVAKANSGETIKLVKDATSVDGILIADKNLTIDLNGKTYTVSEGSSTNNRNFKITGTSEVVIKNGTMVALGELTSGAYGTVRTEGSAKATLNNVKLYSYRGYGLNVKANTGSTIVINDSEIYAQYSGGVEAAGGTIELNNTKIQQSGVYSGAAWCSVAIGVNGGGKVIVNSGEYSAATIATDSNAAQGTWIAYVMSSGGTLEINGGTFNGTIAETASAANACGIICADRAAVVDIKGGTFNSNGAILDMRNNVGSQPNPVATLYGGTFSADPRVSGLYSSNLIHVAEGCQIAENNGVWTVVAQ